ncbi:MAG: hypothetical protein GXY49_01765 [Syntrophomonadaceae bacterium]|nr:hypothetical protein [Syntrophomonadaceae bacterium]
MELIERGVAEIVPREELIEELGQSINKSHIKNLKAHDHAVMAERCVFRFLITFFQ